MGYNIVGRIYLACGRVQRWGFVTVIVKVEVKFTLEKARMAQRWSKGIALLYLMR